MYHEFSACKKGENPFLSFRIRRARAEGHWRLKSGSVVITTVDFSSWSHLNQIFDLNNSKFDLTETGDGARPHKYTKSYFINLDCTKDGAFKLTE